MYQSSGSFLFTYRGHGLLCCSMAKLFFLETYMFVCVEEKGFICSSAIPLFFNCSAIGFGFIFPMSEVSLKIIGPNYKCISLCRSCVRSFK